MRDESLKASRDFTVARPLGQSIVHIENPGCVEYVTCRLKRLRYFGRCPKVEERRKREPHIPSFISEVCAAKTAAYFAGQNSLGFVQIAVEESQVIYPCAKSDVVLMEYGGPLHRRTMQLLAHDAVTDFRVYGIGADVISNRPAVAARFVPGLEIRIVGEREEFFEFIHGSVSLIGRELFNMRVCTWNDECSSRVKTGGFRNPVRTTVF